MKLVSTTGDLSAYYEDKSVAAPVSGMKTAGFTHLDLSMYDVIYPGSPWIAEGDGWKKEIEDARRAAEADGLDFCQAHSPDGEHFLPGEKRDALILATRRSIEACAMLGIPHTVLHAQAFRNGTQEDFRRENIGFLKQFEEDAERFGVDLLIENSASVWNPEYYLRTGREMRDFVETAELPWLHICWDIGHGNVEGRDQYSDILDMGKELRALHVQDNAGTADSHVMPMVGTTNFDAVLRGLLEIGYTGDFTFEGSNTIRRCDSWPHYRRDIRKEDRLSNVPLRIQQKQLSVMADIGRWMLESYGIEVE